MESNTKTLLSAETIERLVHANFDSDVSVAAIEEVTEGWFNAVYLLELDGHPDVVLKTGLQDGKYVLTYERNIQAAELHVYDLLADVAVPVPEILVRDSSRALVDCDYFFMERLPGANWGQLESQISPENRERLIGQAADYLAQFHSISGSYFGYVRDDPSFHHPTWREAFHHMVMMQIADGREGGVDLPYQAILDAFEPHWPLLDAITEPCLVDFDMWTKNIMLREVAGEYMIDGIIDLERAFYGDRYADFICANSYCGDVTTSRVFQERYAAASGRAFTFTRDDMVRQRMYNMYLSLLMGVEVYRYNEEDTRDMLDMCTRRINDDVAALRSL